MTNRDEATIAMINVSRGVANEDEKLLVETMDERLFSDIYEELSNLSADKNFAIEDYYEVEGDDEEDEVIPVSDTTKLKWGLEEDEDEEIEEDTEDKDKLIKLEFKDFLSEFGSDYESEEEANKDFLENYCSFTSDRKYSDDTDYELESLVVDEFSEFLISNGSDYDSSEEAYDDYVRNHSSYL